MGHAAGDEQIHIVLANDHGSDLALWPDDLEADVYDLGLSQASTADLMAFAARWEAIDLR